MKRILLSLLTPLAIGGICLSAFAQIDTSNKANLGNSGKWEIILVEGLKKGMGRLSLNFPDSAEWSIDIFNNQNKFIINRSPKTFSQKGYDLVAGIYNFKLNTVLVENVRIEEGKETRLKTGVHDINTPGHWELRSESKEKFLTSGNKPKKIALPVGKYQLKVAGSFRMIEIKESEIPLSDNTSDIFIIDAERYTMVPAGQDTAMQTKGRLVTKFPLATRDGFLALTTRLTIHGAGFVYQCSNANIPYCPSSYILDEGVYDVYFRVLSMNFGSGNDLKVPDVTIRKGFETRLKVGYLVHSARGLYQIFDASKPLMRYNSQGPARLALPIGNYWVKLFFVGGFPVEIREGEVSVVKPPDIGTMLKSKTITTNINQKLKFRYGRLNTFFPEDTDLKISIMVPTPNNTGYIRLDTVRTYDLLAGNYQVYLNSMPLEVTIQEGKETRIRFGYLDIQVPELSIQNVETRAQNSSTGQRKMALPIGYYDIRIATSSYLVKITEGETVVFTFQ